MLHRWMREAEPPSPGPISTIGMNTRPMPKELMPRTSWICASQAGRVTKRRHCVGMQNTAAGPRGRVS